ncbi:MAG: carboxyl transferase [Olpidium bornovanus]|uniref:Carboxyl transferase n=1 Tax=Olpidium bornovanus TaxID=278681 RepID=A0A8H7ZYC5_9FUNG|nr:MAG: carboxyl transferase [Olpidium bornovanus]
MHKNGVSHLTATDDLDGVTKITEWLSFVPDVRGALPPIIKSNDPVDRLIEIVPPKGSYAPRHFLAGKTVTDPETGEELWLSGFFDKGSFVETLAGWARTVVRLLPV